MICFQYFNKQITFNVKNGKQINAYNFRGHCKAICLWIKFCRLHGSNSCLNSIQVSLHGSIRPNLMLFSIHLLGKNNQLARKSTIISADGDSGDTGGPTEDRNLIFGVIHIMKYITTFISAKGNEPFFYNIQLCAQVDQINVESLVTTFSQVKDRFGLEQESNLTIRNQFDAQAEFGSD